MPQADEAPPLPALCRRASPHRPEPLAPAASASVEQQHSGRSKRLTWPRPTRSTRSTRRATTGPGSTVALVEMSGAGYLPSDINSFASCYGITLANGQISQKTVDGGGATGGGTAEAELDIETVLSLAPKANIEVYEGGSSDSLYTSSARSSATTRPRSSAPAGRTAARPTSASPSELGEHALPGRRRGGAVDLRRLGRPGRAGMQHQRKDRGDHAPIRWRRPWTPRPAPCTSPTSRATSSAWTARAARAARPNFVTQGLGDDRLGTRRRSARRRQPARCSWPTPRTAP